MKYPFYKILIATILLTGAQVLLAQDETEYTEEDYEVVLPEAAQSCVLPTAPDAIPEGATKEDLLEAKEDIGEFQAKVTTYRDCLSAAETGDITPGNKQAIVASYNYSVEMEERIANRFNDAIRDYKERQGDG